MDLKATEIAAALGISRSAVSMWGGKVPATRRVELERLLHASHGTSVEDFGSDVQWHRVPDSAWPHPGGRPCIDVAAPATAETAAEISK